MRLSQTRNGEPVSAMNRPEEQSRTFMVTSDEVHMRLDVFLSTRRDCVTRSQARKIIDGGLVRLNGTGAKPATRLRSGDIVVVAPFNSPESSVVPEDIPLNVIYDDEALLVIDKPAGVVVHPAAGHHSGTLVNALMFHCDGLSGIGGVKRPGIIHRLDKHTSGIMIVAKTDDAHVALSRQFKEHTIKKVYRAVVHGDMDGDTGVIELPVGRHPTDRKKMSTRSRHGKPALTRWRVVQRFGAVTSLDVQIKTGRTHQIRVHLHAVGHPIIGDTIYGDSHKRINAMKDTELRRVLAAMTRQALHAATIGFIHPVTTSYMECSAPLPADMTTLCAELTRLMHEAPGSRRGIDNAGNGLTA
jgi:23S rRNA pseudouridine1911/1915/1917 synthase